MSELLQAPARGAPAPGGAPEAHDCGVVELRQYTLHPGRRDALVELFEREFVETQEAVGLRVMGQFTDLDDPDRFVWLRGFADMASRRRGLQAFYGGPVWARHREQANATMVDSDDVRLLRPAWPGAALRAPASCRAEAGSTLQPAGLLEATVYHLRAAADAPLLAFCRDRMAPVLREAGGQALAWYVTEPTANDFPRLAVREGEPVLVGLALFRDEAQHARFAAGGRWAREVVPGLSRWLAAVPQTLRLRPTARSALHAGAGAAR